MQKGPWKRDDHDFQDPMTALNPLKKIGSQIEEVIIRQKKCSKNEAKEKALEMLKK